jgi:hypothetical protein
VIVAAFATAVTMSCTATQELPSILWNLKVTMEFSFLEGSIPSSKEISPLVSNLNHINPFHTI